MNLTLIIALILAFALLLVLLLRLRQSRKLAELQTKIHHAVSGRGMRKVSFTGAGPLYAISHDFNTLAERQMHLEKECSHYTSISQELDGKNKKIADFESSLSQVTLLTDIGKKITSSLKVRDILQIMFSFVQSSMDAQEMELLYKDGEDLKVFAIDTADKILVSPSDTLGNGVLHWSMDNGKEVFLNDAVSDYGQYVYDPIRTSDGATPAAYMVIPLTLHGKAQGALGVSSVHSGVYNDYHLDFLRTVASYLSVALDNSRVYQLLEDNKVEIEDEKRKSDELLRNILPAEIAEELKNTGTAVARRFEEVSILFTDFKEFTQLSQQLNPEELVRGINHCFKAFDTICEKYEVEKIKTIGDSYMAAGGIPSADPLAAKKTVLAALEINAFMLNLQHDPNNSLKIPLEMRVGINTGPVVAGIVGIRKFQYDIWGDAVNTASRMESNGAPGKVNISESTYALIKDEPEFTFESRGMIPAKGKGEVHMYFVQKRT